MKAKPIKLLMMATVLFAMAFVAACSDDDGEDPADDRTALEAKIAEAEEIYAEAVESDEGIEDQYPTGSKATLQEAIDAAQEVLDDESATQQEVNSATTNLQRALDEFDDKKNKPIAYENLIARWKFDEGEGTDVVDDSDNALDGEFKTGHTFWGAGDPTWATDRHGNANKAIYFDDGANIEVPYNTKLNPQKITISLWMKQDVNEGGIVNNQYMIAMNRWNGYKFNMQDVPKPFFTAATASAIFDHDSADPSTGLPQGTWYHLAVTFGDDHMIFYIDGVKTKDWNDVSGTLKDISSNPVNFTIGQDLPTSKYETSESSDYYVNWGGYFIGVLDDIRIYNTVLAENQIQQIYDNEKPD